MLTKLCKVLKNQKGFTLIELLAVVVILGIISAIAVPSIGGIIDNTKKDAHIANAKQMISSAKLAVASDNTLTPKDDTPVYLSLKYLEDQGYLEPMEDPDGKDYIVGTNTEPTNAAPVGSYVEITKDDTNKSLFVYKVKLDNNKRYIGTKATPVLAKDINRNSVKDH